MTAQAAAQAYRPSHTVHPGPGEAGTIGERSRRKLVGRARPGIESTVAGPATGDGYRPALRIHQSRVAEGQIDSHRTRPCTFAERARVAETWLRTTVAVDRPITQHVEGATGKVADHRPIHLVERSSAEVDRAAVVESTTRQKLVGRAAHVEHPASGHRQRAGTDRPAAPSKRSFDSKNSHDLSSCDLQPLKPVIAVECEV